MTSIKLIVLLFDVNILNALQFHVQCESNYTLIVSRLYMQIHAFKLRKKKKTKFKFVILYCNTMNVSHLLLLR